MSYSRAGRVLAAGVLLSLAACSEPVTRPEAALERRFATGGSELLVCPGGDGQTVEAEVGSLGGALGTRDHRLVLPPGAVSGATKFRMTVPRSDYVEVNIKADDREGFSFGATVEAWIDYGRCPADVLGDAALTVWKIHPESKALLKRMPSLDDRANRRVLFQTDSLSSYSIAH